MLKRVGAFGAATETTPGTAVAVSQVAADLMLCEVAPMVQLMPEDVPQNVSRNAPDELVPVQGGIMVDVPVKAFLKGTGTAGGVNTTLDALLLSCGMTKTTPAGRTLYRLLASLDLASQSRATCEAWLDGKYFIGRGVAGEPSFDAEPSKVCTLDFKGKGVYSDKGDQATPTAPTNVPPPPIVVSARMVLAEHHSTEESNALDGSAYKLQGASSTDIGRKVLQGTTTQKLRGVLVNVKKLGTPAAETHGFWVEIQSDSTGSPSGTPITGGVSEYIPTSAIGTGAYEWVLVLFSEASLPTLAASTPYWVVVRGDYMASDTNCLSLSMNVCTAPNQLTKTLAGASWSAESLENLGVQVLVAVDPSFKFTKTTLTHGNAVALQDDPNDAQGKCYGFISDRKGVSVKVDPLEKKDAYTNFRTWRANYTDLWFGFTVGQTAGNMIEFRLHHCKVKKVDNYGDRANQVTQPLELQCENPTDFELNFK